MADLLTDYKPRHDHNIIGNFSNADLVALGDALDQIALHLGLIGQDDLSERKFDDAYIGRHAAVRRDGQPDQGDSAVPTPSDDSDVPAGGSVGADLRHGQAVLRDGHPDREPQAAANGVYHHYVI